MSIWADAHKKNIGIELRKQKAVGDGIDCEEE